MAHTNLLSQAQLKAYINNVKYHDDPQYDVVRRAVLQYMVQLACPQTTGNRLVKSTAAARVVQEGGQIGKCGPVGVLGFTNALDGLRENVGQVPNAPPLLPGPVWLSQCPNMSP
jgi:hypothetical protein